MDPFIRLNAGAITPNPATRLVKAKDYRILVAAETLIADAQRQAETILAEAEREAETRKRQGYEEGLARGKMEMATQMIDTVERTVSYFAQIEDAVVGLVLHALRKILGEFREEELLRRVVRQALQVVHTQHQIKIRVAPEQQTALNQHLSELLAGYKGIGFAEVVADARLGQQDCVLETEIGVVDASLDVQLQALERALQSRLARQEES